MSLVEKALGKARSNSLRKAASEVAEAAAPVEAAPRVVSPPAERVARKPQLVIGDETLRRAGLYPPNELPHQLAAECRNIKRGLLNELERAEGRNSNVTLITSVLAGEGKTFTAFHLALSMAKDPDFSVLLIDADTVRPRISRALGVDERPGLVDAAFDAMVDVESLVLTTNIEGLSFLPVGRHDVEATDLFASQQMQRVMGRLSETSGRLIVMDSLPLLQTTEALALVANADAVVVVVRAGVTPRAAIVEALEQLSDHPRVMTVLNAAEPTLLGKYLGHGYGYHDYSAYAVPKNR